MKYARTFAGDAASVTAARRFARESLGHVPTDTLNEIALMVSELATNCVRFTPGDFTVGIDDISEQIRVEVTDHGWGQPKVRFPRPDEASGRGLLLVDAMSADWGVDSRWDRIGKTVWFTVSY
jgi:anti-sigma regulatory factor (Ser/Thr protein kinase)